MPSLGELIAPRRLGRDFRWLLSSSWTSNLGDGIALSAAPLLLASLTSSPLLVAAGAMMQFLPWLLFGLFAGSVADHHDRRRLVMIANGSRAVLVLALVAFLVTGQVTVWIVLAAAFLYGTAEVFADTRGARCCRCSCGPAISGRAMPGCRPASSSAISWRVLPWVPSSSQRARSGRSSCRSSA